VLVSPGALSDLAGNVVAGAQGMAVDTAQLELVLELEPVGYLLAPHAGPVARSAAAALVRQILVARARYQMASGAHTAIVQADYLAAYAERFSLPVRTLARVDRLQAIDGKYVLRLGADSIIADNVVVATGTFGRTPSIPDFALDLDPSIRQLHSSEYRRPVRAGDDRTLRGWPGDRGAASERR